MRNYFQGGRTRSSEKSEKQSRLPPGRRPARARSTAEFSYGSSYSGAANRLKQLLLPKSLLHGYACNDPLGNFADSMPPAQRDRPLKHISAHRPYINIAGFIF